MSEHTLQELKEFIEQKLPKKLRADHDKLHILKEADIECCAYMHIRNFLGRTEKWRVYAHKYIYMQSNKRASERRHFFFDLMIYEGDKPTIAIEIKHGKHFKEKINDNEFKDLESLKYAIQNLRVKKAYWILGFKNKEDNSHEAVLQKSSSLTTLHFGLNKKLSDKEYDAWEKKRDARTAS